MLSGNNIILIKRNDISGVTPASSSLLLGELGINTADGKLFTKTVIGSITSIVPFSNDNDSPYTLNHYYSSVNFKYGNNTINQIFGSVLGGYENDITGGGSTVINGENNDIAGDFSLIGSGYINKISADGDYSFIAAGSGNIINHQNVFILGSNIKSISADFTYVNNLSSTGILYGNGSGLTNLSGIPIGSAGGDLTGIYPNPTIKNSVSLGGIPTASTASAGTNTNQLATTEFVINNAGDRYLTTSNTSNIIDNTNGKTFVVSSSTLAYTPTQDVTIVSSSDPLNYHMHCTVVSYTGYNLVVDVKNHTGNGTHTDWVINVGGYTTQSGVLLQANNLSDLANVNTALTNLGAVSSGRLINTGTGLTGGGDLTLDRTISIVFGNTSSTAVSGDDPRLSDSRTPIAHKSTHAIGGSDVLTPTDIGAVSNLFFGSVSGNWDSVYSNVQTNSSNWNTDIDTEVRVLSSNWQNTFTNFNSQSSNNISVYNTVISNSATTWNYQGTDVKSLTSNWENTYTQFLNQSGDNISVFSTVKSFSANWDIDIDTEVRSLTSNWESTYTTFKNNSSNYITNSNSDYLPLSGGVINGNLSVTGTISSAKTVYSQEFYYDSTERPDLTGVKQALDELLYTSPAFNSLTVSGGNSLEVGQSLSTPSISWSTNKTFTSITLTFPNGSTSNGNGSFLSSSDPSSYSYTSSTGSKTWSVQGSDWKAATANRSTTVNWYYKIYMGAFNTTTPSSSDILNNLQHSALATGRTALGSKSITLSNEYFYIAYPTSFGTTSQLKVNGLNFTDLASVYTINPFTNASGGTASYYVYRTNNKLTGTYTMEVL